MALLPQVPSYKLGLASRMGADGENELDIEFSQWDGTVPTNADFTYYPPTGYGRNDSSGTPIAADEDDFSFSLFGETLTTARTVWSSAQVVGTVMRGLQPLSSSSDVLHTHTYAPPDPAAHIPQVPVPLGINFWSFQAVPAHNQEVIIRDFQYLP